MLGSATWWVNFCQGEGKDTRVGAYERSSVPYAPLNQGEGRERKEGKGRGGKDTRVGAYEPGFECTKPGLSSCICG